MDTSNTIIGVTLGDATGIGPELIVKAFQDAEIRNMATWLIAADKRVLKQGEEIANSSLEVTEIKRPQEMERVKGHIYFIDLENLSPQDYNLGEVSVNSGKVTGETLKYLLTLSKEHLIDGVLYAPLNKEALHRGGRHFQDEMHFFADILEQRDGFSEINVMNNLWVTRVTSHIPIKNVSVNINKNKIKDRILFAHNTLKAAGINEPKIVVAALNPHAGEGGMIGTEEIEFITPAIEAMQKENINVAGPYPADTLFLRRDKDPFDCLLAMYHDQAQTGMKLLGFNRGVTMSGGFPITLATPAHGTAFDIAGKNLADPGATIEAMKMVVRMTGNKKEQLTKN